MNVWIPYNYPKMPPEIKFETYIHHCNVTVSGKICIDLLGNSWDPIKHNIQAALNAVLDMLLNPTITNALDSTIAYYFMNMREKYNQKAKLLCTKHANKSVDRLFEEIYGEKFKENPKEYGQVNKETEQWIKKYKLTL